VYSAASEVGLSTAVEGAGCTRIPKPTVALRFPRPLTVNLRTVLGRQETPTEHPAEVPTKRLPPVVLFQPGSRVPVITLGASARTPNKPGTRPERCQGQSDESCTPPRSNIPPQPAALPTAGSAAEQSEMVTQMASMAQLVFDEVGIKWDSSASRRFQDAFAATLRQSEAGDSGRTVPPEEAAALAVMVACEL
jgi:hypothetical protein